MPRSPTRCCGVVVVGARLWFAYAANHNIRISLDTWAYAHQLTSSALIDAFIFLALAMVLTRTGSLAVRSRALRAPAAEPAAGQPVGAQAEGGQRAA
jgi:hypothetical protein